MADATILKVIPKDGTSYDVTENGAENLSLRYQVVLSGPMPETQLITAFASGTTAIPAINSAHPARAGMYVARYKITQPRDEKKHTLDVTVEYAVRGFALDPLDPEEPTVLTESQVLEWGWDDGTTTRELTTDVTGKAVVNSAGDPFDSVPEVEAPSPTFTKVMKFKTAQSFANYVCKVNQTAMQIGGWNCPAGTLLCTVAEKMNISEPEWPYTYTVRLRYRTNMTSSGSASAEEIGWQVSVVDAGMRERDATTGDLKQIQVTSKETGSPVNVSSPALLDGEGHALDTSGGQTPYPVTIAFQAYETADFPSWFTSKPVLTPPSNTNNGNNNSGNNSNANT